jgi:glycerol uptake facilitator protein
MILVLLGNGVVANVVLNQTKGNKGGWIVITFGWGMAVFVAVSCVAAASGAHLNPAVTIGLLAAGKFDGPIAGYILAQFAGAMAGALLVYLTYMSHYLATADGDAKLATFSTGPAIRNTPTNLFGEAIGTFVLVFAVLMAENPALALEPWMFGSPPDGITLEAPTLGLGSLGALPVGLIVFAIGLSLGGTTGYAINPARDLGPRIIHAILSFPNKRDSDWSYAWIPVVGPILGALAAAGLYVKMVGN